MHPNGDHAQYLDHTFRCRHVGGVAHVADDESSDVGWFDTNSLPVMDAVLEERILRVLKHSGQVSLD